MGDTLAPYDRAEAMNKLDQFERMITIEPIMQFDLDRLVYLIKLSGATSVNIGADSGNNHLPEPPKEKIMELISELEKFTAVKQKSNLKRLLK